MIPSATRPAAVLAASVSTLAFLASPLAAATWNVPSIDCPTVQAGIDSAAVGDTVLVADGTYTGSGNRDINFRGKAIVVRSESNDPSTCVIDCQGSSSDPHRGFIFSSGEPSASVLQGVTIRNGHSSSSGGGVLCTGSEATIRNCVVEACTAESNGGGFLFSYSVGATVSACTVIGNDAGLDGGGIYIDDICGVTVEDSHIAGNAAQRYGGGIGVGGLSGFTDGFLERCVIVENWSGSAGGGVSARAFFTVEMDSLTIAWNSSGNTGGGLYLESSVVLQSVAHTILWGNMVNGVPGTADSEATIVNCDVDFVCCDVNASGVQAHTGTVITYTDCVFSDPLFCDPGSDGDYRLDISSPCAPDNSPAGCGLIGALPAWCVLVGAQDPVLPSPVGEEFGLRATAPNPFRRLTAITYSIPQRGPAGPVSLRVYDVAGRLVRTLVNGEVRTGTSTVFWDGTDHGKRAVGSGIYFCRLEWNGRSKWRRLVFFK